MRKIYSIIILAVMAVFSVSMSARAAATSLEVMLAPSDSSSVDPVGPGMTDEEAAELFMMEYESLQKQFTMVYNTTVNADSIEMKADSAFLNGQTFILNSIYKNMAELQTWAMESMEAGTLAQDVEEILGSFENIQIQLTQFYNTFWDELNGDEPGMTDEEAAELFMMEYESLQKQFTMVYNTTVNADSIEMKADSAFINGQTFILNSIYKNMAELQTWAMESMEAGTLAQDVEEILGSFENIQIQLTQFYNTFWGELNGDEPGMTDEEAAELFMMEYESLQKQFTMVYNTTVNADSIEMKADSAFLNGQTFILNSIQKNMAELQTWAMESMEAGTLAQDVEEILGSFENIQIQLTQFYNTFWGELNGDEPGMTDEEAAELFMTEYESLQKQFTMVYNTTVNADSIEMKADSAFLNGQTFILNSIYKNMAELETWAVESMEAGTLAQDVEEILGSFENIQIQLTQFYNTFWEELNGGIQDGGIDGGEPIMSNEEAWLTFKQSYDEVMEPFNIGVDGIVKMLYTELVGTAEELGVELDITIDQIYEAIGDTAINTIRTISAEAEAMMTPIYAKAEQSYKNGNMGKEFTLIMGQYLDCVNALEKYYEAIYAPFEKFTSQYMQEFMMLALEKAQVELTKLYNNTINNPSYAAYAVLMQALNVEFNKLNQELQNIIATANGYYEEGTLIEHIEEIDTLMDAFDKKIDDYVVKFNALINTNIDDVQADGNDVIYTINGVKVDSMDAPGIYIVNGKKYVVE